MRLRVTIATLVGMLVAAGVAARVEAKPKIGVLGMEAVDEGDARSAERTADVARWITEGLRNRAQQARSRFDLAPNAANKELTELKLLSDCMDEGKKCMSQIGRDLGAGRLMFGSVERKGGNYVITVKFLNVDNESWEGKGKIEETIAVDGANEVTVRRLAAAIFAELTGLPLAGTIVVTANVATGMVYLDGTAKVALAGRTATIADVPEGSYNLAVEADGYKRWEGSVDVAPGDTVKVPVKLEPEQTDDGAGGIGGAGGGGGGGDDSGDERPGGTSRALFWTTLVVTAGGVASFTITGLKVRDYEEKKVDAIVASEGAIEADSGDNACREARAEGYRAVVQACDNGEEMATVTNVLIGVTAVMAVASGYFYYKGYIAAKKKPRRSEGDARRKRKKAPSTEVVVTPEIFPTGAGVGAVIRF